MSGVGFTDFFDATTARQIAQGGGAPMTVILDEINALKSEINSSAAASALSVTVTNTTTMTGSVTYFEAWNDAVAYQTDAHNLARARMDQVIYYFARLGYLVRREREGTADRFQWVIKW